MRHFLETGILLLGLSECFEVPTTTSPDWRRIPNVGIHVGSVGECDRDCPISVHDVIMEIDGKEINTAPALYEILADGELHEVSVWRYREEKVEAARLKVHPETIRHFGFAAAAELTNVPSVAQGHRLGCLLPSGRFIDSSSEWQLPQDFWGRTTIVLESGPNFDVRTMLSDAERSELPSQLEVDLFFVHVGTPTNHAWAAPVDGRVHIAYTDSESYATTITSFPNLLVVDCQRIIRWHMDPADVVGGSLRSHIDDANAFAARLEALRVQECWR